MGGIIRQIFSDNWEDFVNSVGTGKIRPAIFLEVERMLSCGDFSNGYAEYHCTCGEKKRVAFTCKSICPSCGALYTERWVESMSEKMFAFPHRHVVFTIPEELRSVFAKDRTLLKVLSDTAAHVIKWSFGRRRKTSKVYVAVIAILHTFGRDLKWNPHVHVLVAEGYYIEETDCWKKVDYIHYEQLLKSWQFSLLKALRHEVPQRLINKLYKDKDQGFYVHAQNRMRDARGAAKYIGRYVGRPAIAERRIISYDGKQVTFWYEKHDTKERVEITLPVYEFIGLLIRHIAEKGFKMVRHYGLYARTKKEKVIPIKTLGEVYEELKARSRSWRTRIKKSFGIDPLCCEKCGRVMHFYDIVWPKYGSLLGIMKKRMEKEFEKEEAQLKEYYENTQSWDAIYMPPMSA